MFHWRIPQMYVPYKVATFKGVISCKTQLHRYRGWGPNLSIHRLPHSSWTKLLEVFHLRRKHFNLLCSLFPPQHCTSVSEWTSTELLWLKLQQHFFTTRWRRSSSLWTTCSGSHCCTAHGAVMQQHLCNASAVVTVKRALVHLQREHLYWEHLEEQTTAQVINLHRFDAAVTDVPDYFYFFFSFSPSCPMSFDLNRDYSVLR